MATIKSKSFTLINIRDFHRNLYQHLDKLPLMVMNAKTGKLLFKVEHPSEDDIREVIE